MDVKLLEEKEAQCQQPINDNYISRKFYFTLNSFELHPN